MSYYFTADLTDIVICMPHRGRLNFLTGMLDFPPEKLFRKLKGSSEFPDDAKTVGDVASHLVSSTNLKIDDKSLHVTMLRNPSHLEAVNPVSMGKTRGIMQIVKDGAYSNDCTTWWSDKVLNLQVIIIYIILSIIHYKIISIKYNISNII